MPVDGSFAKTLYNGLMKLIVVRSPLPLRNFCWILLLAPKHLMTSDRELLNAIKEDINNTHTAVLLSMGT